MILFGLGGSSGIVKCYHQDCHSEGDRRAILSTSFLLLLPILVAGCTLTLSFAPWLSSQLLGSAEMRNLLQISALSIFLASLSRLLMALIRARQEAMIYVGLAAFQFLSLVLFNIYFVAVMKLGVKGILWGTVLSEGLLILLAAPFLRERITFRFEKSLAVPLLTFGVCLLPAALAGWVMHLSDRYLLRWLLDLEEVGVYSLGYKFGMLVSILVVWPFQLGWPAFSFSISSNSDHRRVYARVLTYLLFVLVFMSLSLALFSQPLLRLVATEQFNRAYRIVPPVALAYTFYGIAYCVMPGIHLTGKTKFVPLLYALAATINVFLNLLLIPSFGMIGAAWATTTSFFLLAVVSFLFSNHVYPITYEYFRMAIILVSGFVLYCLGVLGQTASTPIMLAWHFLIVFTFPLLLIVPGILEPDEKKVLLDVLTRIRFWQSQQPPVGKAFGSRYKAS